MVFYGFHISIKKSKLVWSFFVNTCSDMVMIFIQKQVGHLSEETHEKIPDDGCYDIVHEMKK